MDETTNSGDDQTGRQRAWRARGLVKKRILRSVIFLALSLAAGTPGAVTIFIGLGLSWFKPRIALSDLDIIPMMVPALMLSLGLPVCIAGALPGFGLHRLGLSRWLAFPMATIAVGGLAAVAEAWAVADVTSTIPVFLQGLITNDSVCITAAGALPFGLAMAWSDGYLASPRPGQMPPPGRPGVRQDSGDRGRRANRHPPARLR